MNNHLSRTVLLAALSVGGLTLSACAGPLWPVSHGQLQEHVSAEGARANNAEIAINERVTGVDQRVTGVDQVAQDAVARADAAAAAAKHPFAHQVLMSDDSVKFGTNSAKLSTEAQSRLSELASKMKADDKNVYVEIQGHADARGSAGYNLRLAERRSEAVRRYLADQGVPLERMTTISYGKDRPKSDATGKDADQENRRVVVNILG